MTDAERHAFELLARVALAAHGAALPDAQSDRVMLRVVLADLEATAEKDRRAHTERRLDKALEVLNRDG